MRRRLKLIGKFLRRPKIIVILLIIVGIIFGIVWFYHLNQSPAEGVVDTSGISKPATSTAPQKLHFDSQLIAFDYPGGYTTATANAVGANVIESYSLRLHDSAQESRNLAITVKKPEAGSTMTDDSAYVYRRQQASLYDITNVSVSGADLKKATKKDGSEITYFIPGPTYYAIISGTSTNPGQDIVDNTWLVASSFRWQ